MKNLEYRMDGRDRDEFKRDIGRGHKAEDKWADVFEVHLGVTFGPTSWVNHGSDSSDTIRDHHGAEPDKLFTVNSVDRLVEIKTNQFWDGNRYHTIKVHCLRACQKSGAYMMIPMPTQYMLIGPEGCKYILDHDDKYDQRIYIRFSATAPAVRLEQSDIDSLVKHGHAVVMPWADSALALIKTTNPDGELQ